MFKCRVGISDHSLDNRVAIASIACGAEVVEKHIALDNQKEGFDIDFSIKGKEIKKLRNDIDIAFKLLGKNFSFEIKMKINQKFSEDQFLQQKIKRSKIY